MHTTNPLADLVPVAARERQTAARFVAESLRTAIRTGALVDGAELNQVALAEHFGTSRVPVREALRALEAEGWITALPHRRAVVQALSAERIDEIFDVRGVLEAHVVRAAVGHIDDRRLAVLGELCDEMDALEDHLAWVAANRRFHHALLDVADAPMTLALIEQLGSHVERYLRLRGRDVIGEREAGDEHREILAAAAERDAARAADLIAAHIDHTRRRVRAALDHDRALAPTGDHR